jgi:hypothetical protein
MDPVRNPFASGAGKAFEVRSMSFEISSLGIPAHYVPLLKALWQFMDEDSAIGSFSYSYISKIRDRGINLALVKPGISWLTENGFLESVVELDFNGNPHQPEWYFTLSGIELVHKLSYQEAQTENSDWIPLKLDRSQDEAAEAIAATEELLEAARGDNGLAAHEPELQQSLVLSLKSGLEAIKTGSPTREQVIVLLKQPIQFLMKKFSGMLIGDLADKAASALSHWLPWLF